MPSAREAASALASRLQTLGAELQHRLSLPPVNYNPLELQLRALLEEMRDQIQSTALPSLRADPPDLLRLRNALEIVYRADEAAQPAGRSWIRASVWMRSAPPPVLNDWRTWLARQFELLLEMVPAIRTLYGPSDTRFIVPSDYRREPLKE